MRIVSLVDNISGGVSDGFSGSVSEVCRCGTEHGVSLYIELDCGLKVLFDTGQSDLFARNAAKLGIDLSTVDLAVISHGHYDHGGGLEEFLRINTKAPVYIREPALEAHYSVRPCGIADIGLKVNDLSRLIFTKDIETLPGGITLFTTPAFMVPQGPSATTESSVFPGAPVTPTHPVFPESPSYGHIPDDGHRTSPAPADSPCPPTRSCSSGYEHQSTIPTHLNSPCPQGQFRNPDDGHQPIAAEMIQSPFPEPARTHLGLCPFPEPFGNRLLLGADHRPDDFRHEQSMIIRDGSSTVLFGGCAHRGIVNILAQAQSLTSGSITHVISGFHLSKTARHACAEPGHETTEKLYKVTGQLYKTTEQLYETKEQPSTAGQPGPDEYLAALAQALSSHPGIEYYTMHCTGEPAFTRLAPLLSPRLHYLPCGSTLTL